MGGFCEARTSGGHLKAPDMYAAALAQHYCLDEVRREYTPMIKVSFMWPGFSLPLDGSMDSFFMHINMVCPSPGIPARPR